MSNQFFIGVMEYFFGIGCIFFEGWGLDNFFVFKVYDVDWVIGGKIMQEYLCFVVCYWYMFCNVGYDLFGLGICWFLWEVGLLMVIVEVKVDVVFEFFIKFGVLYWCFYDIDLVLDVDDVIQYEKNFKYMVGLVKVCQEVMGIKLLWGIVNFFLYLCYMNGVFINLDFGVVVCVVVQVKVVLEVMVELGGEYYVFWGGWEGYVLLVNMQMKCEFDYFVCFFMMVWDYGCSIGLKGNFLIEFKLMELMNYQYDFDSVIVVGFLKVYGLDKDFKFNIEVNYVIFFGYIFEYDLQVVFDYGLLGSIDVNCGNGQNGWDMDQFLIDLYDIVGVMLVVLWQGGLEGGLNFDVKLCRELIDLEDLFIVYIGGMDVFVCGLEVVYVLLYDLLWEQWCVEWYVSFDSGVGRDFENGMFGLIDLVVMVIKFGEFVQVSGKQECYENFFNQYLLC